MFYIKDLSFLVCVVTTLLHFLFFGFCLNDSRENDGCLGTFYTSLCDFALSPVLTSSIPIITVSL